MKEKLKEKLLQKRVLFIFLYFALFLIATSVSYIYFSLNKVFVETQLGVDYVVAETQSVASPSAETTFNVLLLGHGGAGHQGGSLMDSVVVAHIDTENKKVGLISIPRDLYMAIPTDYDNKTNHKINEAYSIGLDDIRFPNKRPEFRGDTGAWNLVKYAAEVASGLPIDYFIAADFGGFKKAIDLMDGIEVDVPKTYDDYFYPIKGKEIELCGKSPKEVLELHQKYTGFQLEKQFECRYEHIHFDKGTRLMDGETALKYTRSRHGDGDFGRSERQFVVLKAFKEKIISLGIIPEGGSLFDQLTKTVRTDIGPSQIKTLTSLAGNPEEYKIISVHLTEDNVLRSSKGAGGAFILLPREGLNKWSQVENFIYNSIRE